MANKILIAIVFSFCFTISVAQKPLVWIYTDMTDSSLKGNNHMGTINDPDDISAMAGYLLMANMFDTRGIVVGSTHRKEHVNTSNQAVWANKFFGDAYQADVVNLNKKIGGYPGKIQFLQSCIKESAERFDSNKDYISLKQYSTVKALLDELEVSDEIINVLCWGSLTEPAILVKHCMIRGKKDILKKLRFIAHWTNSSWHQGSFEYPDDVANCREDADACAYMKLMAMDGCIQYYECGAIGQHGIVSGSPKGIEYYDQFKTSCLGTIFKEGKFVHNCVDHSDSATYWVLLEDWGVGLKNIKSDGINKPQVELVNEKKFLESSVLIHDELLRRSIVAGSSKY